MFSIQSVHIRANYMVSSHYLSKVLDGKQLEFKEESLIQPIDSEALRNTIIYLYGLKNLNRQTLKYILREGAKSN